MARPEPAPAYRRLRFSPVPSRSKPPMSELMNTFMIARLGAVRFQPRRGAHSQPAPAGNSCPRNRQQLIVAGSPSVLMKTDDGANSTRPCLMRPERNSQLQRTVWRGAADDERNMMRTARDAGVSSSGRSRRPQLVIERSDPAELLLLFLVAPKHHPAVRAERGEAFLYGHRRRLGSDDTYGLETHLDLDRFVAVTTTIMRAQLVPCRWNSIKGSSPSR